MALQEDFERQGNWLFRYRGVLPIAILAIGVAVFALTVNSGRLAGALLPHWHLYEYSCLAVSLVGLVVRILTVGYTPAGTSGRNTNEQVAECLNKTGIYSVVRHPLYLGNFLMWLGIALLTCNAWFVAVFVVIYWIYYERIMYAEEQFLRRKFGHDYLEWASRTPALLPRPKGFARPAYPFSWKKIVKKEKNGCFALLLIFCLFDSVMAASADIRPNGLLIILAIVSCLFYVSVKYLKKHSRLLDEMGR